MEKSSRRSPLCIRIAAQERERLELEAGDMPLSAYVRSRLFDTATLAPRRRMQRPIKDREVLAQLGNTRLANNLNQIARATHTGSLPFHPDTERDMQEAYLAIQAMRQDLLKALGLF